MESNWSWILQKTYRFSQEENKYLNLFRRSFNRILIYFYFKKVFYLTNFGVIFCVDWNFVLTTVMIRSFLMDRRDLSAYLLVNKPLVTLLMFLKQRMKRLLFDLKVLDFDIVMSILFLREHPFFALDSTMKSWYDCDYGIMR